MKYLQDSSTVAQRPLFLTFSIFLASCLTACGGGGGGSAPAPAPTPSNSPPQLIGNLSQTFPENSDVTFVLTVDDADGDTVTVTIGNSSDGQFFTLDTGSGEIRSTQPFDFEAPQDADQDNVYVQTVTLDDGTVSVDREVRVIISNVDEPPVCDIIADVNVDENVSGAIATLSGTDPDAGDDDIAVFADLSVSDTRVENAIAIDSVTGEVSLVEALDAEAFEDDFTFTVLALYRTNGLFDQCAVNIVLNDLPARVTSGVLFDDNLKNVQRLPDLDANGVADFWMGDVVDAGANEPATGSLVFGETFMAELAATGAAEFSVAALGPTQRIRLTATISLGLGNATSLTVRGISDLDGDGTDDLVVIATQPPNDGLDPTRRPWGFVVYAATIAANSSGAIDLNTLTPAEGFSLTGPVDFNGGNASYVIADLDGVAGDELAIALPEALGIGSEAGRLYIIDGVTLAATSGNLDFDLAATTRVFEGSIDIDALPIIGRISAIADLDADGAAELAMQSGANVALLPSTNTIASTGGSIDSLNALILDLEGDAAGELGQADVDGDASPDLLLARGDGSANTRQAAVLFGQALAPILNTNSTVAVNDTSFGVGDYIELTSSGRGGGQDPVRLRGIGDLDDDGRDELVLGLLEDASLEPGVLYIIRGAALANLMATGFNVDNFTAADGVRIGSVPFRFTSLSTALALTPDIDGDGLDDFYLTSNLRLADDPPGIGIILKSSDVNAALTANESDIDIESLYFDETPVP